MTNTIIENCKIIDGLGNASYQGKVFIADNIIVNKKSFERTAADVVIDTQGKKPLAVASEIQRFVEVNKSTS